MVLQYLPGPGILVNGKVVTDDDIARGEFAQQFRFEIGAEPFPVHGPVYDEGCAHAVVTQCGDERAGFVMAMRHPSHATLSPEGAPARTNHLCVQSCLINEDQPGDGQPWLALFPALTGGFYVGTLLLGCVKRFFYRSAPAC